MAWFLSRDTNRTGDGFFSVGMWQLFIKDYFYMVGAES